MNGDLSIDFVTKKGALNGIFPEVSTGSSVDRKGTEQLTRPGAVICV
jgi:hypothetical protein